MPNRHEELKINGKNLAELSLPDRAHYIEERLKRALHDVDSLFIVKLLKLRRADEALRTIHEIDAALKPLKIIIENAKSNVAPSIAAAKCDVTAGTARAWMRGVLPLEISQRLNQVVKGRSLAFNPPRRSDADFAYFLGVIAGTSEYGSNYPRQISFSDTRSARRLVDAMVSWYPGSLADIDTSSPTLKQIHISIGNEELASHINEVTKCNRAVPWIHLADRESQLSFLRGFFEKVAAVRIHGRGEIMVAKMNGAPLLAEIGLLLIEVGIFPLFRRGTRASLQIKDTGNLKRFRNILGFASSEKRDALNSCLQKRGVSGHDESQIAHIRARKAFQYISDLRRQKSIKLFLDATPDPRVATFIFRATQCSVNIARQVSSVVTWDELKRRISIMKSLQSGSRNELGPFICSPAVFDKCSQLVARWPTHLFAPWTAEKMFAELIKQKEADSFGELRSCLAALLNNDNKQAYLSFLQEEKADYYSSLFSPRTEH